MTRAARRADTIDSLIDFADGDGDGNINYAEFTKVLTSENVFLARPPAQPTVVDLRSLGGAWATKPGQGMRR